MNILKTFEASLTLRATAREKAFFILGVHAGGFSPEALKANLANDTKTSNEVKSAILDILKEL